MGASGSYFYPQASVSRINVAIAAVKALGLDPLAQSWNGSISGILDSLLIPSSLRGYVAIALSRNLIKPRSLFMRPFEPMTRAELAMTAAALQQATR